MLGAAVSYGSLSASILRFSHHPVSSSPSNGPRRERNNCVEGECMASRRRRDWLFRHKLPTKTSIYLFCHSRFFLSTVSRLFVRDSVSVSSSNSSNYRAVYSFEGFDAHGWLVQYFFRVLYLDTYTRLAPTSRQGQAVAARVSGQCLRAGDCPPS